MMRSCSSGSARRCTIRFLITLTVTPWRGGSEQNKCWPWFHFTRHQVPFLSCVKRKKEESWSFLNHREGFFFFLRSRWRKGGIKVDCGTLISTEKLGLFLSKGGTAKKIKRKRGEFVIKNFAHTRHFLLWQWLPRKTALVFSWPPFSFFSFFLLIVFVHHNLSAVCAIIFTTIDYFHFTLEENLISLLYFFVFIEAARARGTDQQQQPGCLCCPSRSSQVPQRWAPYNTTMARHGCPAPAALQQQQQNVDSWTRCWTNDSTALDHLLSSSSSSSSLMAFHIWWSHQISLYFSTHL